ncbi:MAG: hypothetical protein V4712_15040 [Pseudomonadota bacterium]
MATRPRAPASRPAPLDDLEALRAEVQAASTEAAAARKLAAESNAMIRDLHKALMEPQPGYEHSLLERMATVTIGIESGDRTGRILIKLIGFLGAIASLGGILYAIRDGITGGK